MNNPALSDPASNNPTLGNSNNPTGQSNKQSVLIISGDKDIAETLSSNNNSGFDIAARETWDEATSSAEVMGNNGIIILDIDSFANTQKAVKQLIKIKQDDPTQVLMVVGDKEQLSEFLKSNTQALIYRAFPKPINSSQVLLAFKSGMAAHDELITRHKAGEDLTVVGPAENRATLDTISESNKTNPILYIAAGLGAVAVAAWLALSSGGSDEAPVVVNTPEIVTEEQLIPDTLVPDVSRINDLNRFAANSILDGRLISPEGHNALAYYNQVLEIDPYDNIAYEGKQEVATQLRANYGALIEAGQFDEALNYLSALKVLQPLNAENETMALALEQQVQEHISDVRDSGSEEDIAKTSDILQKVGPSIKGSQDLSDALKAEAKILKQIDSALNRDAVLPSQDGNAYAMLSDAIKKNSISKTNIRPRVLSLSEKLMQMASASFKTDNLDDASQLLDLVKPLKVNREKLEIAETKLQERRQQIALANAPTEAVIEEIELEKVEPIEARILPAKLVKRAAPNYPRKALQRNIEGWVEVSFKIDTDGKPADIVVLNSEPAKTFDKEAIRSIKSWRFTPAMNEQTSEPIESIVESTKVTFKLQ